MLISRILAWIATLAAFLLTAKFAARLLAKKNRRFVSLNRWLHSIHIPCGVAMVTASTAHGLLAGNFMDATPTEIEIAPVLFTWNAGTAAWMATLLLALTYLLRKALKKRWMTAHRMLTALFAAVCVLHIATTGIGIDTALISALQPAAQTETDVSPAPQTASTTGTPAPETDAAMPSASPEALFAGVSLRDGVYTGTADGYHGPVTVAVTVTENRVSAVEVIEQDENARYFSRALAVIDSILSRQTWDVDAVSGATYSSEGITNAVKNALESAVQ